MKNTSRELLYEVWVVIPRQNERMVAKVERSYWAILLAEHIEKQFGLEELHQADARVDIRKAIAHGKD